jgi:O-antigen ligase/cytochrome c-type biogenesis protein CcmH/NrfG
MMTPNKTLTTILRYTVYVLLAATLFTPLIVANGMFFPFITGKAYTFRILVEVAFAVWLVLALFDKNARPKISPLLIGVTLFTIVALITDLTGFNPIRSIWSNFERSEGWITIIHLWAYFVVMASVLRNRIHWHRFLNVSFIVATIVAFWGVFQFFHWASDHGDGSRLDGSLGNAEYLAVYMLINAFLALYMSIVSWSKKQARGWMYLVLFIFYSLILVGTQTRGTILALIGASCLVLLIVAVKKDAAVAALPADQQKTYRILRIVSGSLIGLIIVGSLGFYAIRNTHFVQSHDVLQRMASISVDNPRIEYIWPMAWQGFKEKPILGWGQENFNYVFNDFYNPKMWGQEQWFDRAHNVFIDWAIAGGVLGLAFYVALYVLSLMAIWKSRLSVLERAALTGLIVGYAIHNMFVFDNLASYLMFFITLGFLHSVSMEGDAVPGSTVGRLTAWSNKLSGVVVNPEVTEWIVAPILVVLLAGSVYFFNIRPIEANYDLIAGLTSCSYIGQQNAPTPDISGFTDALAVNTYVANQEIREQLYNCAGQVLGASSVPDETKLAFYQATVSAIQAQAAATPNDLRGFLFGASFLDGITQYSAAAPYAQRAYALSPVKQSVLFELASNEIGLGSTTPALALLKTAYDEDPTYPQAQSTYARGLYLNGQYPQAISLMKEVTAADPTNVQDHISLAMIYMGDKDPGDAISELNIVASSSIQYAPAVAAAIKEIKAGKNPFAPSVASATATAAQ